MERKGCPPLTPPKGGELPPPDGGLGSVRGLGTFLLIFSLLHFLVIPARGQLYEQTVKEVIEALAADSLTKAGRLIEQAIGIDPYMKSNTVLYQYLGEIRRQEGKPAEAIEAYSKGLDLVATSPRLLLGRASAYLMLGNQDKALTDLAGVLDITPSDEQALFYRAFILSSQRKYKEARADYDRLLQLNPMHEDARLGLAILNGKDGRPREALEQFDALVQLFPTHTRHLLARCGLYTERKEYEKARTDVETALRLEPDNPECYLSRASLYLAMRKRRLARQDCRTAISLGASPDEVAPILAGLK